MPKRPWKVDPARSEAAGAIGALGGAAGTGAAKRRSPEHYQMIVKKRIASVAAKKAAKAAEKPEGPEGAK